MQQSCLAVAAVDHDHPEDFNAVEPVRLGLEKRRALFYSSADQRVLILRVRYLRVIAFEQNLVQPGLVVERAQSGFKPLDRVVSPGMVEALVVEAADLQHGAEIAGLGQEAVFIPEPVQ